MGDFLHRNDRSFVGRVWQKDLTCTWQPEGVRILFVRRGVVGETVSSRNHPNLTSSQSRVDNCSVQGD